MIEISHLYKSYSGNIHALKNIDLRIGKGEFVFLVGPSGAGKSTLFKMLSAFDKPTSGKIIVGEHNLAEIDEEEIPSYRRKIGVVFQDFKLLKNQSVLDNIALPLKIRGDTAESIPKKVNDVLIKVGLADKAETLVEFLSGGEQQRVAIARALVHNPILLIADEPTGNLDPVLAKEIMDLLVRVCSQGTTVMVASHDIDLVNRFKRRTIEIRNGHLSGGVSE